MQAAAKEIFVLAYHKGGELFKYIIEQQPLLRQRISAIAFVESTHRMNTVEIPVIFF